MAKGSAAKRSGRRPGGRPDDGPELEIFELDDEEEPELAEVTAAGTAAEATQAVAAAAEPDAPAGPGLAAGLRALRAAARDGVAAIAAAVAVAFVGLAVLIHVAGSHAVVGYRVIYAWAAWFTGASLALPVNWTSSGTVADNVPSGFSQVGSQAGSSSDTLSFFTPPTTYADGEEIRATVWVLTLIVLVVAYMLGRRAERRSASGAPGRLALHALTSGVFAALAVLVLVLTSHLPSLMNDFDGALGMFAVGTPYGTDSSTAGLATAHAFIGPLLIVFAAALVGRLSVWIRVPHGGGRTERVRVELERWAPAARTSWLQARVVGVLGGLTLLIYALVEIEHGTSGSVSVLPLVLAGILLFGNLAVYGALGGFGATLYVASTMTYPAYSTTPGVDDTLANSSPGGLQSISAGIDYGMFGEHRPWIVWLLLAAAVLGTLAPVLLSRWTRCAVRAADLPPAGVWRAALLGAAGASAAVLIGRMSLSSDSAMTVGTSNEGIAGQTASVGPSLLAPIALSALWFCLGYLALSFAAGNRPTVGGRLLGPGTEAEQQGPEGEPGEGADEQDPMLLEAEETLGDAAPTLSPGH